MLAYHATHERVMQYAAMAFAQKATAISAEPVRTSYVAACSYISGQAFPRDYTFCGDIGDTYLNVDATCELHHRRITGNTFKHTCLELVVL